MGIFGTSTADNITDEVERATNENNSEENWELIINICDKAGKSSEDAKNYLRALYRRLNNTDPHIAIQAVTLLDACVKNSGKLFHIEVASREFETEFTKLVSKSHSSVSQKLKEALKRWSDNEFKTDKQLHLIPALYNKLRNSGIDFSATSEAPVKKTTMVSKDPNVVETQQEENDILKAIELSLKEQTASPRATTATSNAVSTSLYPSTNTLVESNTTPKKESKKVRALYDFEAVEDNELTFHTGEIILVSDDSDPNWWKGSNQRGEGLFPSNFVTSDLAVEPEKFLYEKAKKTVQGTSGASEKNSVKDEPDNVEINEDKINHVLHLLHEADPTNPETDTEEMLKLEREVYNMGPLIDSELERVDRKHAQLTQLSADLVEALGLYHTLMREPQQFAPKMPPFNFPQQMPGPGASYNGMPPAQPPPGSMGQQHPGMGAPHGMPQPPIYASLPMMQQPGGGLPPHLMGQHPGHHHHPPAPPPGAIMPQQYPYSMMPGGGGYPPPPPMLHNGPPPQSPSQQFNVAPNTPK